MTAIYVPQSKLAHIKALVNAFNKELHSNGLGRVSLSVEEAVVRDWYVTERYWENSKKTWKDEGIKKKVKLHKITLQSDYVEIEGLTPIAYINGQGAKFDDLLNEPVSCSSVSFSKELVSHQMLKSVFDEKRSVKCDHCNSNRRRDKAFFMRALEGEDTAVYGANCVHSISEYTSTRLVRWYGFFKHKYERLLANIQQEIRIVTITRKPEVDAAFSFELFISNLHDTVMADAEFHGAKSPLPTYKRVLSSIVSGEKIKASGMDVRFSAWVKKMSPSTKFHKNARFQTLHALKEGVSVSNAALIAALYNDFLKSIKFSDAPVIPVGYTSGLAEISDIEHASGKNCVLLKDVHGRRFIAETLHNYPRGRLIAFEGIVLRYEYQSGVVSYYLSELKEFSV
tara:strand:- start:9582 stop:10772 length:1191 start_codon:yes stop_codon:yes gene_type:complete